VELDHRPLHLDGGVLSRDLVNAFNFLALIGGLRQQDSGTLAGVSYFALGMALLVPLYAFVGYILWRMRNATALFYASFIALFGFFMFAPRMHERYLFPALLFVVPLALQSTEMMVVFAILTVTCLFNLAYVKHTLESAAVFLDAHDGAAMLASALNLAAFAIAVRFGLTALSREGVPDNTLQRLFKRMAPAEARSQKRVEAISTDVRPLLPWIRLDTIIVGALLAVTIATRFWHLGTPPEIVFDEVHFVGQAREYLHSETFLDPHPPVAKLLIALSIWIFGDHSWSWRVANAVMGTILVGVTYLLGRRMFKDRLAATLAAGCVVLDGFFLVDSRIACIDIVYLTFAAISYLLLFRFLQTDRYSANAKCSSAGSRARNLSRQQALHPGGRMRIGGGFRGLRRMADGCRSDARRWQRHRPRSISRAARVRRSDHLATVTAIFYLSTFLINYFLGWWGGISDCSTITKTSYGTKIPFPPRRIRIRRDGGVGR